MSKFMEVYEPVAESWRTIIDKLSIGKYFNDKINGPIIDKFVAEPKVQKICSNVAKRIITEKKRESKGLKVFSDVKPDVKNELPRRFDDDDFNYIRKMKGYSFIISTDGKNITSIWLIVRLVRIKDNKQFYDFELVIAQDDD